MIPVTAHPQFVHQFKTTVWSGCLAAIFVAFPTSLQAGSVTSESIWSQDNALQRALQRVPSDRTITRQKCKTIQVRNSDRYRCTITYD